MPPLGWIKTIRTGIGMSMEQLGKKLSITKQAVMDIEKREKKGAITIKAMQEIATKIVLRTSTSMKLEDQPNSKKRIETAIKERASEIINNTPKILWN